MPQAQQQSKSCIHLTKVLDQIPQFTGMHAMMQPTLQKPQVPMN
jgi:hypothetical protein